MSDLGFESTTMLSLQKEKQCMATWKLYLIMARSVILVLFTTILLKDVKNLEQVQGHIMKITNI